MRQSELAAAGGRRLIGIVGVWALVALVALASPGARAASVSPSSIEVAVEQGRLSVDVRDAPLDEVLRAVGEEAEVGIEIRGDLTVPVTASFADVPLDEGIRRLLRGHSYTLAIAGTGQGRRIEISILTSHSAEIATGPTSAPAPDDERARLLSIGALAGRKDAEAIAELGRLAGSDPSPAVRLRAIAALGRLRTPEAWAPVTLALTDESTAVRIQALRSAKTLKGADALPDLQAVATHDTDPGVRKQAIRLMADIRNPDVPWLLGQAAADSDPAVSEEASKAARRWEQRYGAGRRATGATR